MADVAHEIAPDPFPARSKTAGGLINGTQTDVSAIYFSDKIVLTISQDGRLAHWVQVPLAQSVTETRQIDNFSAEDGSSALLPMPQLTASTVLGGTLPEAETVGQMLGAQIGTAIVTRTPGESRVLVVGLGLVKTRLERSEFMELLDLVLRVV